MIALAALVLVLGFFSILWNRRAAVNHRVARPPPLRRHRTRRAVDIRITPG
jgi:hypothetical protein